MNPFHSPGQNHFWRPSVRALPETAIAPSQSQGLPGGLGTGTPANRYVAGVSPLSDYPGLSEKSSVCADPSAAPGRSALPWLIQRTQSGQFFQPLFDSQLLQTRPRKLLPHVQNPINLTLIPGNADVPGSGRAGVAAARRAVFIRFVGLQIVRYRPPLDERNGHAWQPSLSFLDQTLSHSRQCN
jgi:hypothetical protein